MKMNINDWIQSLPEAEAEALRSSVTRKAGAEVLREALFVQRFIDEKWREELKQEIRNILMGER